MIRDHDDAMLELASLRAIDALEADEAATIDRHMETCAECRAEFARSRTAGVALAFAAATPAPDSLRSRVLSAAVKVRRLHRWYERRPLQGAIAAAAIIVAVGTWLTTHRSPVPQRWAAHCTAAAAADCGTVVATGSTLRLDVHGLPALPAGKVYQAWIIPPKRTPIPEPTFVVAIDGTGTVSMSAAPERGAIVAVTEEPAGGSKAPTSKPILVATLM